MGVTRGAGRADSAALQHLEAKARQSNRLAGYKVVVAQVLRSYGDQSLGRMAP